MSDSGNLLTPLAAHWSTHLTASGCAAAIDDAHGQRLIRRGIKLGNITCRRKGDAISLDQPLTNNVEVVIAR